MRKSICKIAAVEIFSALLFFSFVPPLYSQASIDDQIRLAQNYEQTGQYDKAEEIYKRLCDLQPSNYQFTEWLNHNFIAQKKYSESVELLSIRIKSNPADINLYGLLGSTYYMQGKQQNAYDIWENGIAVIPNSYITYRITANYAIENRDYNKAIEYLNRGKKYTPDPAIFSYDLANIYTVNMRFKDAASEYCGIVLIHPDQTQGIKARIAGYLNKPDAGIQTVQVINELIDTKPTMELYDLLSFVYQRIGDYENAFKTIITLERKYKTNGTYIFTFAQEMYRNQVYEWAAKAYKNICDNFSRSPFFQIAKIGYARTLESALDVKFNRQNNLWKPLYSPVPYFTEEYKNIINVYEEFIKIYKDDANNSEALFRIAKIYCERIFDYDNAISYYEKLAKSIQTSNYNIPANIELGRIYIQKNDLEKASFYFLTAMNNPRIGINDQAEAGYYLACIQFWKGAFSKALEQLNNCTKNLNVDYSNDALELSFIITTVKKDSINLQRYANADLYTLQNKYKEAGTEFNTLSKDSNLFLINNFAKITHAEILIADNNYTEAIKILEKMSNSQKNSIFAEKSMYLMARCFQYGIGDLNKAREIYQKILETFPNSLYFDRSREEIISIQKQNGQK